MPTKPTLASLPFAFDAGIRRSCVKYSISTIVNDCEEYIRCVDSFLSKGFAPGLCEYLYADNVVSNRLDAFQACNAFILEAQGEYIVICHQDILLLDHDIHHLDTLIDEISALDPDWAVLGNAGIDLSGKSIRNLHDPHGFSTCDLLPVRVQSVDENFLIVKRSANLALSSNLHGFHFYAADLCLIASFLGYNAYVINFFVFHKSAGKINAIFWNSRQKIIKKYQQAFAPKLLQTPCVSLPISQNISQAFKLALLSSRKLTRIFLRLFGVSYFS